MLLGVTWITTCSFFLYDVVNLWNKMFFWTYHVNCYVCISRCCGTSIRYLLVLLRWSTIRHLHIIFVKLRSLLLKFCISNIMLWLVHHCVHCINWILNATLVYILFEERTSIWYLIQIHLLKKNLKLNFVILRNQVY